MRPMLHFSNNLDTVLRASKGRIIFEEIMLCFLPEVETHFQLKLCKHIPLIHMGIEESFSKPFCSLVASNMLSAGLYCEPFMKSLV